MTANDGDLAAPNQSRKQALRAIAKDRRRALDPAERRAAETAICGHAVAALGRFPQGVLSAYWAFGDELDPQPVMAAAYAEGWSVGLPVTRGRGNPLMFRTWHPGMPLVPEGFGVKVPPASAAAVVPSLVLTPLLAIDRQGNRIGYGAGFYDRTLAELSADNPNLVAIGLAFSCQIFDTVPADPHDRPLHGVIDETGLQWFGAPPVVYRHSAD